LLGGEAGVTRLGDGGPEDVKHTDVRPLPGDTPEPLIENLGVKAGQLRHAADTEPIEVTEHGGSDGNEVLQPPTVPFHIASLTAPRPGTSLI